MHFFGNCDTISITKDHSILKKNSHKIKKDGAFLISKTVSQLVSKSVDYRVRESTKGKNMALIKSFKEIICWQKSHQLALEVYRLTTAFPKIEDYCLTNQIRRAVISVPSNIAEGFKRRSLSDSKHFYNIAQGSLEEVKYQLLLAKDLGYITSEEYVQISMLTEEVSKLLVGWIKVQK